jgi:hypothetical protein
MVDDQRQLARPVCGVMLIGFAFRLRKHAA